MARSVVCAGLTSGLHALKCAEEHRGKANPLHASNAPRTHTPTGVHVAKMIKNTTSSTELSRKTVLTLFLRCAEPQGRVTGGYSALHLHPQPAGDEQT